MKEDFFALGKQAAIVQCFLAVCIFIYRNGIDVTSSLVGLVQQEGASLVSRETEIESTLALLSFQMFKFMNRFF